MVLELLALDLAVQPGPSTPFVKSLSQNLNLHLTVHKLNGKNYLEWAQFVKLAMGGKGKPGYLTGVEQQMKIDPS